jgi:hypothetical protein
MLITFRHHRDGMESEVAERSSWDQANRGEKLGLVWRNRKKISQIINDYLYLPFFILIILCYTVTTVIPMFPELRDGRHESDKNKRMAKDKMQDEER